VIKDFGTVAVHPFDQPPAKVGEEGNAVEELKRMIRVTPSVISYNDMGYLLFSRGDVQGALQAYQDALKLDAQNTTTLVNLGIAYLQHNQPKEAAETLEKASSISPENFALYRPLLTAYRLVGDPEKLEETIRRGLKYATTDQQRQELQRLRTQIQ
jgi:Flp pilus assembly protein TadD